MQMVAKRATAFLHVVWFKRELRLADGVADVGVGAQRERTWNT